mmetsp:Transcript_3574/g.6284  ORF Transcript_3574/g.6284 Transcript_3574/m.6284 type:complete len:265 (+) Transcript_3574:405-1199(+)
MGDLSSQNQGDESKRRVEEVARAVCRAAFLNSGQVCLCGSRILVQEEIFDEFVKALVECTEKLKVGDPFDSSTDLGPVSSHAHRDKVQSYIDLARNEGGLALCGGGQPDWCSPPDQNQAPKPSPPPPGNASPHGAFLLPTLVTGLDPYTSRAATEEVFGPFATIHPFATEEEAISIANATPYGLCASVWTSDLERAHRVSSKLDVGMVWVNTWLHRDLRTAFGGVKASGLGREGGNYSLDFFSEAKNVCIGLELTAPPMPGSAK